MRAVRLSKTFIDQLNILLAQGIEPFGARVVAEKRDLVYSTIEQRLTRFPKRTPDPEIGLCVYPVSKTPFVLIYDFDDSELRVHFVLHSHADRTRIDPRSVQW